MVRPAAAGPGFKSSSESTARRLTTGSCWKFKFLPLDSSLFYWQNFISLSLALGLQPEKKKNPQIILIRIVLQQKQQPNGLWECDSVTYRLQAKRDEEYILWSGAEQRNCVFSVSRM